MEMLKFSITGHLTIVNNTSGKVINPQPKSGANGVIARYEGDCGIIS